MSTFFSWQRARKKSLLLGARLGCVWGFAALKYDARSLAHTAGVAAERAFRLCRRWKHKR